MSMTDTIRPIRTRAAQNCYLCGTVGRRLYEALSDRRYALPGCWHFNECSDPRCGLVWLDPVPVEQDIARIYENYFAHQDRILGPRGAGWRAIHWFYRALLWATGLTHQRSELFSLYLRGTRPGRLLEAGCGDGGQLAQLRGLGWEVEGQEIDAAAAERARSRHGLRVHLGALQDIALPESAFDVVAMSHVIEHVHDPVALLTECHRILKPGGRLIAVTPNINSLGHRRFGSCWMGLDPPRHLHLFSSTTLRQAVVRAGFTQPECWTTAANAQFSAEASLNLKRSGRHKTGTRPSLGLGVETVLFQFWAMAVHPMRKVSGEECVLRAVK